MHFIGIRTGFFQWTSLGVILFGLLAYDRVVPDPPMGPFIDPPAEEVDNLVKGVDYFLPKIDLHNWKATLAIGNPTEVSPPKILDYANDPVLHSLRYYDTLEKLQFRSSILS